MTSRKNSVEKSEGYGDVSTNLVLEMKKSGNRFSKLLPAKMLIGILIFYGSDQKK